MSIMLIIRKKELTCKRKLTNQLFFNIRKYKFEFEQSRALAPIPSRSLLSHKTFAGYLALGGVM